MRFWVNFLFALVALLGFERMARANELASSQEAPLSFERVSFDTTSNEASARHVSLVGVMCQNLASRVVARDIDLDRLTAPSDEVLDGGRSATRGMSVAATDVALESDQGCIDRVRGDEVENDPLPLAFDVETFDPAIMFADVTQVFTATLTGMLSPDVDRSRPLSGVRPSLERPPRA